MLRNESVWIKEQIGSLGLPPGAEIIDIGSSTARLREIDQPYIGKNIFSPLAARGCIVTHADKRPGRGIDLVLDIEKKLALGKRFDLAIMTNVLEHVSDITTAVNNSLALVRIGGHLVVSVPSVCHYHPDPIDTLYRPSMRDLKSLFQGQEIVTGTCIQSVSPADGSREEVNILIIKKGPDAESGGCAAIPVRDHLTFWAINALNRSIFNRRKRTDQIDTTAD